MGLFDHFPYTNVHELNLDWILSMMKALEAEWEAFTAGNSLQFADPMLHDISKTYAKNTIVLDGNGNAYVSLQAIPVGVGLQNGDYWLMVFDYEAFIEKVNKNFTANYYRGSYRATAAMAIGDWLTVDDVLYKATAAIAVDDILEDGVNITHFTLEDFIKAFMQSANQLIQQYKNDIDASELLYRQQLAQDIANTTASLQAQLDAAISGATVDSEVINARVGADGITYPTLGDAIRSQVTVHQTFLNGNVDFNDVTTKGYYIVMNANTYTNSPKAALPISILKVEHYYTLPHAFNVVKQTITGVTNPSIKFTRHAWGTNAVYDNWTDWKSVYDDHGAYQTGDVDLNTLVRNGNYLLNGTTYSNNPLTSGSGVYKLEVDEFYGVYDGYYAINQTLTDNSGNVYVRFGTGNNHAISTWSNWLEVYPKDYTRVQPYISSGNFNDIITEGSYVTLVGNDYTNAPCEMDSVGLMELFFYSTGSFEGYKQVITMLSSNRPTYQRIGVKTGGVTTWQKWTLINDQKKKNVLMFGDSILARRPTITSDMLQEHTTGDVYNCCLGGSMVADRPISSVWYPSSLTRLVVAIEDNDFTDQENMAADPDMPDYFAEVITMMEGINYATIDLIILMYGTNDFMSPKAIGDVDSSNTATISGAFNFSIDKLTQLCPKAQIVILTPLFRMINGTDNSNTYINGNGDTLRDVVEAEKATAAYNNLPCIDLYNIGICENNDSTYSSDGTHLKDYGKQFIGDILIKNLLLS